MRRRALFYTTVVASDGRPLLFQPATTVYSVVVAKDGGSSLLNN
ncbi:MAG: hypothetical protein ABIH21_02940 [Patescibacteria group bacterium]